MPVLLCHGLGANRFTFDLDARVSLAVHLRDAGWDVFTLELRGHGRSQKKRAGKRWGWSTHDYCAEDLPAALNSVIAHTGADAVHMIGHSMGGILLHAQRAMGDPRIRSGITLASALDYSGTPSVFHGLKKWIGLTRILPAVPLGPIARFFAPIALAVPNPVDAVNVNPSNVDRRLYRRLVAVAFHGISSPVLQSLSTAFEPGGMIDADGSPVAFCPDDEAPILSIVGTTDPQCHPDAAGRSCEEVRIFGRAHGHAEDYGHFDLIMGKNASREVWPVIVEWLERHD